MVPGLTNPTVPGLTNPMVLSRSRASVPHGPGPHYPMVPGFSTPRSCPGPDYPTVPGLTNPTVPGHTNPTVLGLSSPQSQASVPHGGLLRQQDLHGGGWAWAWWLISDIQRITLEIMTLQPKCDDVETAEGVAITVTGVAQFLGKTVAEIKSVILQTLEGHLRSILGTLTVEQIYQDRDRFATLVREVASPDVGRMGIEILSFTIKDVYDKVEYLSSLGKTQTAAVQRDADIGVAEAERDAGIKEADCKKEMMDAAKEQQKIRLEEIEIEVVQRKKQITIEEKEVMRMDKELIATAYKIQQLAEGHKMKKVLTAQAEAEKIRRRRGSIEAVGKAEAEKMRLKAEAYLQYGEAAKTALVLEALPKIAGKVAAPLARTKEKL
ncbi:hypothetical protein CRUP_001274 [Coryphaenoides rupestris]|nr:hypothetical protein CRUP_001274 [Coryphaenoides rupestris]